jgi:hypothetical protein
MRGWSLQCWFKDLREFVTSMKGTSMKTDEKKSKKSKAKFTFLNENVEKEFPDRSKFCGILKTKFDPIAYQRKMRNEWK